jgi:organic hydroperoxide reductase OsmC/OhrA
MRPLPHHYEVHLTAGPSRYAELSTAGVARLRTAPPAEYDGPGDAWSPEHLLLASVQACFLFTFRAIARVSKVEFIGLELSAAGTVDRRDGVTRFTEIILRPRLTVAPGTNRDSILQILHRSERACLVSASLATPVRLEPEVTEARRDTSLAVALSATGDALNG